MNPQPRGPELALTILAISTAIVGFGLFNGDFFAGGIISDSLPNLAGVNLLPLSVLKLFCAAMVMFHYASGCLFTKNILLRDHEVTGKDVADGPLTQLFWQVFYVALIFILNVIEESLRN